MMIRLAGHLIRLAMLNSRQLAILGYFRSSSGLSSQGVQELLKQNNFKSSLVTVKRDLAKLVQLSFIQAQGKGRAVNYSLTANGKLLAPIDAHAYCQVEPDKRAGISQYDFSLLSQAAEVTLFSAEDQDSLRRGTESYCCKSRSIPPSINKKEMERFIIELSWKSSKIEGNTYTILDTERLIRDGIEAPGKSKEEAIMILNHKKAFIL